MNDQILSGMHEATRLTRAGQLAEASALIQSLLGNGPGSGEPRTSQATPRTIDLRPDAVRVDAPERDEATTGEPPRADASRRGPTGHSLADVLARLKNGETGIGLNLPGGLDLAGLPGLDDLPGLRPRPAPVEEPLPEGARFESGRFTCAAGSRNYRLYVPGTRSEEPPALVVMLHGCTQDATDFAAGTAMNRAAEQHGCLVLYPEQAMSANPNRCWNWFEAQHQRAGAGEPMIIAGMVRQVMKEHGIDPGRVFAAGLSAGGAMAAVMAATHPELFKGLGVHSGLAYEVASDMPSAFAAMRDGGSSVRAVAAPMPTIVFHGDGDRTVHPANAERVVRQWRSGAGAGPERIESDHGESTGGRSYSRTRTMAADGRAVVEQWMIHGAGHAWSGGSANGSYTDPAGPDASAEMLRFFLEATARG